MTVDVIDEPPAFFAALLGAFLVVLAGAFFAALAGAFFAALATLVGAFFVVLTRALVGAFFAVLAGVFFAVLAGVFFAVLAGAFFAVLAGALLGAFFVLAGAFFAALLGASFAALAGAALDGAFFSPLPLPAVVFALLTVVFVGAFELFLTGFFFVFGLLLVRVVAIDGQDNASDESRATVTAGSHLAGGDVPASLEADGVTVCTRGRA